MKILTLADGGIGGTEKAATIFACGLKDRGHKVIYSGNAGPRIDILRTHKIEVFPAANSPEAMQEMIENIQPDIIHQHVPGYPFPNPIYDALEGMGKRPKFVQTNVFGWLSEKRALETVDRHLFISRASGSQAFRRARLTMNGEWLKKCSVVMYPMPESSEIDTDFRDSFRTEHGISEETCLAIRVGRPSNCKWTVWEAQSTLHAHELGAKVHLILLEPPTDLLPKLKPAIDAGLITIIPATSDFEWLGKVYSSADVMLHASNFGESFGYTIAEGMLAQLPIITRSTPWGDSAQVELVENRVTGYTCATTKEMGRRFAQLANSPNLRLQMGIAAKQRITDLSDSSKEISLLENHMLDLLGGEHASEITKRNQDFLQFHQALPFRENTFSEDPLPITEAMEWKLYSSYRALRTCARVKLKRT